MGPEQLIMRARILLASGDRAAAVELLRHLEDRSPTKPASPTALAGIYVSLGDREQAVALLERAYAERDFRLRGLKTDPDWDPFAHRSAIPAPAQAGELGVRRSHHAGSPRHRPEHRIAATRPSRVEAASLPVEHRRRAATIPLWRRAADRSRAAMRRSTDPVPPAAPCSPGPHAPPSCRAHTGSPGMPRSARVELTPPEDRADLLRRREQRVPQEAERRERPLTGFLVSRPARVSHDDRNVPKIRSMAHRRLDSDLRRYPDDDERAQPAIAQGHVERRPLERRHRKLVEDGLGGQRRDFWDQLKARRIPEEPRPDLSGGGDPLPGHCHSKLECSHQLLRQRHVAREEDPHAGFACRPEHLDDLPGDRVTVLQLPEDADLHVVDDESGARRRAGFRERLGNLEMVGPDHSRLLFGTAAADEPAALYPRRTLPFPQMPPVRGPRHRLCKQG